MRKGEIGDCMYIIFKGTLGIFDVDSNGRLTLLSEIKQNKVVGEMALEN